MGPIEQKLREKSASATGWIGSDTWPLLDGAAKNIGVEWLWLETAQFDSDVLSEAIEAAEALGL